MNNKPFKIFVTIMTCLGLTMTTLAQRQKGVDPVNLNVTIDNLVNNGGAPIGIGPDGGGTYFNGTPDGVEAQFLSSGVLSFKSGARSVKAYYPAALAPFFNSMDSATNVKFLTFVKSGQFLQTMVPGGAPRCEGFVVNIPLGEWSRIIGYQAGRNLTGSAFVLVTHPDDNTWIMMPHSEGGCSSPDDVARVTYSKTSGKPAADLDNGIHLMPFRITLTRQ